MRTACTLVLSALISANATAQIGDHKDKQYDPPEWAMITDSAGRALDLTQEQMKQVQEADENYRANAKAGDAGALDKRDKDLQAILLPTQYTQWKEMTKARRAKAK